MILQTEFWKGLALGFGLTVNPRKIETELRTISAGIPYTLLLRLDPKP